MSKRSFTRRMKKNQKQLRNKEESQSPKRIRDFYNNSFIRDLTERYGDQDDQDDLEDEEERLEPVEANPSFSFEGDINPDEAEMLNQDLSERLVDLMCRVLENNHGFEVCIEKRYFIYIDDLTAPISEQGVMAALDILETMVLKEQMR